jgi:lysophospholipase L1-like esterase
MRSRPGFARLALLATCVVLVSVGVGCQPEPKLIVLVGDSILQGTIQRTKDEISVGGEQSIPGILQSQLEPPNRLVNVSYGGTTVRDWHPDDWLEGWAPGELIFDRIPSCDVVVILLGTNDAVGHFEEHRRPVSPSEYEAKLLEIVERLQIDIADNILLVTPPLPPAWRGKEQAARIAQYPAHVLAVCEKTGVACLDLAASMPDRGYIGGIHPSAAGHAFIAAQLLEALAPLLGG